MRPGPIQGDMVHPYLRRRQGLETGRVSVEAELEAVLEQDARRAAVPGAGDEDRHRRRRLHAGRGRPAAPRHGDLQAHRHHRHVRDQDDRGHGRATAIRATSPSAASTRSRASANTAFRKAMPRASRCSSMPRPGSSAAIPTSSRRRCSTRSRWASTRRRRSCATCASTASRCGRSTSIIRDWDATLEEGPRAVPSACMSCTARWRATSARRTRCGSASARSRDCREERWQGSSRRSAAPATTPCAISGCARACRRA